MCHTNFPVKSLREKGCFDVMIKVCETHGQIGEGNAKSLTKKHETCGVNTFK